MKETVRNFILLANFFTHWKAGFLSSWVGLADLELEPPNAWRPIQGMISDEFYFRLLNEEKVQSVRFFKIGDFEMSRVRVS